MSKKMLFIYNPMAGKEQIKNKLSEIIQIFCKEGFEVTIFATRGREDATKVIEKKGGICVYTEKRNVTSHT